MKSNTEFFVCEVALGKRPRIGKITRFLQPDVAITTMIGVEHYSAYRSREAILAEKGKLIEGVRSGGFAVINADDASCEALKEKTAERIVTFGKENPADYRVTATRLSEKLELSLTIEGPQGAAELETRLIGEHFWLSTAAAFATCTELGIDQETIRRRIASFANIDTRCQMFETRNGPDFILDTAKAPEETLQLAFDILKLARDRKTRIVLGHISDYSGKSRRIYRKAYRAASECADQVIFVGERAHRSGASPDDQASERFVAFETPLQAFEYLRENAGKDDLILLKSSRNLHLERIAFAFERDVKCWVPVCSVRESCEVCGLWNLPYEEHRGNAWHQNKGNPD